MIKIKTIPHSKQRYSTCGDWVTKKGKLAEIIVSDLKNEDYGFLISVHEFIEAYLCLKKGVTQKDVDAFDKEYEKARKSGRANCGCPIASNSEPGFDMDAPYYEEHSFASEIEELIAKKLGVNWNKYNKAINEL